MCFLISNVPNECPFSSLLTHFNHKLQGVFVSRWLCCGCTLRSQSVQVQVVHSDVSRYLLKHAYLQSRTHALAMPPCIRSSVCVMENWAAGRASC